MTTERLRVEAEDLRPYPSRPVAWLRAHPVVVDVAVVLAACLPHAIGLAYRGGSSVWWGAALITVTAGALMVRRRRPFAVLIVVAVACALSPLVRPGFGFPTIPFSFALYTVASLQTTRRALIGYGVAVAVTALATVPYSLSGTQPPLVTLADPFSLIALATGFLVKSRRDHARWLTENVNQRIRNAALAERTRIAAEMHDVVAHSLTVIVTLANGASSAWRKHPERAAVAAEQIADVGREALEEMHHALVLLRGADAELNAHLHHSGGNLPTLDELAERFRVAGLPVVLTWAGPEPPEQIALRQSVYRIVQESLTNTLRHALEPTEARVTIDHGDGRILLTIEDDGRAVAEPVSSGHGLVGIGQRAAAHGGHAESGPLPGGGWRIRAVLRTTQDAEERDAPDDA